MQLDSYPNRLVSTCSLLTINDGLLLTLYENLVEGIVSDGMRETLDPFVLLFLGGSWHPVNSVFTFNNLKSKTRERLMTSIIRKQLIDKLQTLPSESVLQALMISAPPPA